MQHQIANVRNINLIMIADELLENGAAEEVEIRGASIEAVEQIVEEVQALLPNVTSLPGDDSKIVCNSILVDHFLWDYRRAHREAMDAFPFHKTLSIYY